MSVDGSNNVVVEKPCYDWFFFSKDHVFMLYAFKIPFNSFINHVDLYDNYFCRVS